MRTVRTQILLLALIALTLTLTGCASRNKGKIEGTKWRSQAATVKGNVLPAGSLSLEFGNDMRLVYKAGPQTYTGKYALGMGSYVTLNLDQQLGGRKTHLQIIRVEDSGKLTMQDSDGTSLTFDKVN